MVAPHVVSVSVETVFKIVFAVVSGIVLSPFLSDPKRSEKGFSYISVRILLPCMLFGNLALDISFDFIAQYYWAIIMSFIPMLLGALASFLCFRLVSREFRVLLILGSTFQNGLLFPLSVVTNIRGIAWLDEKAVTECQQYVFLYNLSCALCLWGIGGPMVKHFKDKLIAEQEEADEEAYYERRRHRTLHRFQRELRDRARRPSPSRAAAHLRATAVVSRPAMTTTPTTATATAANPLLTLAGAVTREGGGGADAGHAAETQAEERREEEKETVCASVAVEVTTTAGARVDEVDTRTSTRGAEGTREGGASMTVAPPAPAPAPAPAAATETETETETIDTNDIIAQYRKLFAPQPQQEIVFPQLQDAAVVSPVSVTVHDSLPTRASPTLTGPPAEPVCAAVEGLLDEHARPTVHGQLRWYRPARRRARPIDVAKFDRWRARMEQRRGQGGSASRSARGSGSSRADPFLMSLAMDLPGDDVFASGAGGVAGEGLVAYPPALGEGIYSDSTANLVTDTKAAGSTGRDDHDAEEKSGNRRGSGKGLGKLSPEALQTQAAERAMVEAITHTAFHAATLSPPSTPPPEGGDDDVFVRARDKPWAYRRQKVREFAAFAVQTPPVYITGLAVLISTVPPLRWCAETYVGLSIIKGIALVGTACVPFQLLALGCTLARKKKEAAPLVLQESLDSETEHSTSDTEGAESGARQQQHQHQQQQQQQQQQGSRLAAAAGGQPLGGAHVSGSGAARTGATGQGAEHILSAEPIFNVDEAFAAMAAARAAEAAAAARRNRLTIAHGTAATGDGEASPIASPTLAGDGNGAAGLWDLSAGHRTARLARRRLRQAALRRRREMVAAMGVVRRFWYRIPDATRFTYIVLVLRLVILPGLAFLIVHWLIELGVMPLDRSFIVSILIGVSSPAAVNASLLCTMNDYHAGEFSRMILLMYCAATVTSTVWLAASISYTSARIPEVVRPGIPEDW